MTADTNVVVRLLTNDDPVQAKRAVALFARTEVFLPKTVLLEAEWVLRLSYELDRECILRGLRGVLGIRGVNTESPAVVAAALDGYARGLDLADALHLAAAVATAGFATFDRKLVKRAKDASTVAIIAL